MDARFMQMHNFVLTREIIINSIFPVDRMRELNFHRETAVHPHTKLWTMDLVRYMYVLILLGVDLFLSRTGKWKRKIW